MTARQIMSGSFDVTPAVIKWMAIVAACLSLTAATIAGVAFDRVSDLASSAKQQAQQADETSRAACRRTRLFGPELADAYERAAKDLGFQVLSPPALEAYRQTIPESCPR